MSILKSFAVLLSLSCAASAPHAQPFDIEAQKQGLKGGVHWVKRTWYHPKPGTAEADKNSISQDIMRRSQLIEYTKDGKLRGVMDYAPGTNEGSGSEETLVYSAGRLVKRTQFAGDNEIFTTTYTYDADGNEIKAEVKAGAGMLGGMDHTDESTWRAGRRATLTTRGADGRLINTTTFTYDAAGRLVREDYTPVGLYAARTYEYDGKGHLIKDTYLDKTGQPSTIWTFENNAAGKPVKRIMKHFYQGEQDREEITTYAYSSQGDLSAQKTVRDNSKVTDDRAWQHTYDAKGNRIQTVHIWNGKPQMVEVLELRYY